MASLMGFIMSRIGKIAHVTNTADITPSLRQISLHLPENITWRSCQHLKCETENHAYRDYTIASWDEKTKTAELLIAVGHKGAGGNWAKHLQEKQSFYVGVGGGFIKPTAADNLVCIGDTSAVGHFVSLHKHKHPEQQFHTLIIDAELPATILGMPLNTGTSENITAWLKSLPLKETTFYLAGNIPLLVNIRKVLKEAGWKNIKSAGFWE
jgi:NADPH-dependent ferric siderophore reductase